MAQVRRSRASAPPRGVADHASEGAPRSDVAGLRQGPGGAAPAKPRLARDLRWTALFLVAVVAAILIALSVGRYPVPVRDIVHFVLAANGWRDMPQSQYDLLYNVIVQIRLPRVLTAVLVGSALASSGASFQAVFRNPLVSPELMGVLAGSAFGAALGILISGDWLTTQVLAFVMGLVAVVVAVGIARMAGGASLVMLVLGG